MIARSERLAAVMRDIDLANAGDPRRVLVDGIDKAYEVVYSERMGERLAKMYPDASEILRIAARSQHIRRWDIPRARYPDGRGGYNAWRRACQEHHAGLIAEILAPVSYTHLTLPTICSV